MCMNTAFFSFDLLNQLNHDFDIQEKYFTLFINEFYEDISKKNQESKISNESGICNPLKRFKRKFPQSVIDISSIDDFKSLLKNG